MNNNRPTLAYLTELIRMAKRNKSQSESKYKYCKYVHWRSGQLSTIDHTNRNPYNDDCPLKKFRPTHTDYFLFDEFVRKLSPPFFVKPPEPNDEKDVIYLQSINETNQGNLPPT